MPLRKGGIYLKFNYILKKKTSFCTHLIYSIKDNQFG